MQRALETIDVYGEIIQATTLAQARNLLESHRPDILVADLNLVDGKAYDLFEEGTAASHPLLVMTSHGDEQMAVQAMKRGALDYVVKSPETFRQLPRLLERVWREWCHVQERAAALEALRSSERRLADIIDFLPDATFAIDTAGRVIIWNRAIERVSGVPNEELLGRGNHAHNITLYGDLRPTLVDIVLDPRLAASAVYDYLQRDGDRLIAEISMRDQTSGATRHLWGVASPLFGADGKVTGAIETVRDITEQLQDQARLRLAAAVLASTREGVLVTDASGEHIVSVNRSFVELSGYSEAEALASSPRLLQSGRHDRAFYQAMWAAIERTGYWQGEVWNRRRNGEIFPAWLGISQVRNAAGTVTNYVGVLSDISQVKHSEAQLERLAHYDPLTALPNRLLLTSRLEHAIQRAQRQQGRLAVLFIDLDRFKHVNDSLGHPTGDALLRAVAGRLGQRIRHEDTLARLGGDEFVVVLESLGRADEAGNVAQSLIDALAEPFQLEDGRPLYLGASIGISLYPEDGEEALQLLRNADTVMSQAKAQGRNSYRYYTESLTRAANQRLALESRLRRALEREEFVLHYQPQVAMADERIVGVEALVRWQDPEEGLIPPDRFIPLAEETGLIVPLGDWVMRQACRQMRQWRDAGLPPLTLAVNLSAQQFAQPGLAEQVAALLAETRLPAGCLELELTESILMQHTAHGQASLDALRALGVALSIDDFGTGYSSLAYLKRLPIDKLKIDKSFVQGIPDDRNDAEIATTVIAMARNLRLRVLAEGVETIAQRDFLHAAGCDTYQGYLFSRPVTPDVIADLCLDRTDADPATASAPFSRPDRGRLT